MDNRPALPPCHLSKKGTRNSKEERGKERERERERERNENKSGPEINASPILCTEIFDLPSLIVRLAKVLFMSVFFVTRFFLRTGFFYSNQNHFKKQDKRKKKDQTFIHRIFSNFLMRELVKYTSSFIKLALNLS